MYVMHFFVDGFVGSGMQAAPTRHVERAPSRTVHFVNEVHDPHVVFGAGLQDYGPSAVTEKNASCTIAEVQDGGHDIRPYDQNFLMRTGSHNMRACLQRIDKRRAGRGQAKSPGPFGPES